MTFVDPYFDENIGDLRNLLGAKSSEELKKLEPQIVFANELELDAINIPRTNDFAEFAKEKYLRNLPREDFVKRLAHFYDQLNYIHPFREGNGRAQRVFWNRIAKDAGYELDWSLVVGDENDEASRLAAEQMDLSALEAMFMKIVRDLP